MGSKWLPLCVVMIVCAWAGPAHAQTITMTPNPIDLGDVGVGAMPLPAATGVLTISSNAKVDLAITSCTGGSGTFFVTPNSNINLNGSGASATITVEYMATGSGTRTCTVTAYPQGSTATDYGTFTIRATGRVPPTLNVTQPSAFPSTRWNNAAAIHTSTRNVTVTNGGDLQLDISSITFSSGDFSLPGGTTPTSIAPGAARNFTVTFDPTTGGTRTATMTFVSNDPSGNKSATLSGDGTNAVISVPATPTADFGVVAVGSTGTLSVPITNSGGMPKGPLGVTSGSISSAVTWISFSSCNGSTTPTQSCDFNPDLMIGSTPGAVGIQCSPPKGVALTEQTATVTFQSDSDSAGNSTMTVHCTPGDTNLRVEPAAQYDFMSHLVGTTASGQLTIYNDGTSQASVRLAIANPSPSSTFTVSAMNAGNVPCGVAAMDPDCAISALGGMLVVSFQFTPGTEGDLSATARVTGAGAPLGLALLGRGIDKHIEVIDSVLFPDTYRNPSDAQATVMPIAVNNIGEYELSVTGITLDGSGVWSVVSPTAFTVPPKDVGQVMVRFAPMEVGKAPDGLMVVDSDDGGGLKPLIVLEGVGKARNVNVTPGSVDVGDTFAGVPTLLSIARPTEVLAVANTDPADTFVITSIVVQGAPDEVFRVQDLSGNTVSQRELAAGAIEMLDVVFAPPYVGEFEARLEIYLDDDPVPQTPIPIRGRALWVDAHGSGGFGCDAGGGPRGFVALALGLLLSVRRRRQ